MMAIVPSDPDTTRFNLAQQNSENSDPSIMLANPLYIMSHWIDPRSDDSNFSINYTTHRRFGSLNICSSDSRIKMHLLLWIMHSDSCGALRIPERYLLWKIMYLEVVLALLRMLGPLQRSYYYTREWYLSCSLQTG